MCEDRRFVKQLLSKALKILLNDVVPKRPIDITFIVNFLHFPDAVSVVDVIRELMKYTKIREVRGFEIRSIDNVLWAVIVEAENVKVLMTVRQVPEPANVMLFPKDVPDEEILGFNVELKPS